MFSFRFADPSAWHWLWFLLIILVAGEYLRRLRKAQVAKRIDPKILPLLVASVSERKRKLKTVLQIAAVVFMVLALARPQSGQTRQKVKNEGIELVFVVDVSNSMLAEDAKPNRLDLAKKELMRLLDTASGNKTGLVAFAGSAVVLSPLTTDKNALKMYLESLVPDSVSSQGTDFGSALKEAIEAFKHGGTDGDELSAVTKAVILVSDGEDLEKGGVKAAEELKKMGVHIFSLAVGTEKGGPIPVRDGYGELRGYRKDRDGKVILTQSNGTDLKEIAQIGGGSFYQMALGSHVVESLVAELNQLQKTEFESAEMTSYNERYQIFLILGLICAFLDLLITERKTPGRIWRGRFEVSQ